MGLPFSLLAGNFEFDIESAHVETGHSNELAMFSRRYALYVYKLTCSKCKIEAATSEAAHANLCLFTTAPPQTHTKEAAHKAKTFLTGIGHLHIL